MADVFCTHKECAENKTECTQIHLTCVHNNLRICSLVCVRRTIQDDLFKIQKARKGSAQIAFCAALSDVHLTDKKHCFSNTVSI